MEILVIDDDLGEFKPGLEHALKGYILRWAYSGEDGLREMAKHPRIACILLDIKMPAHFAPDEGREGIEVLKRIKQEKPNLPVIMLTVLRDVDLVVEAIKEGAYHYITKPIDRDKLRDTVARAVETTVLKERVGILAQSRDAVVKVYTGGAKRGHRFQGMVGAHPLMQDLYGRIDRAARFDGMNVVVLGERGSGKELAARAIHECSPRASGPYVTMNCAGQPESVLDSHLFGHTKGSFTGATEAHKGLFELADGGTLFMDEIGDMPLSLQAKLLRAIENKEITPVGGESKRINVRIVCATNKDLTALCDTGEFRADLHDRLWGIPLTVPPLRERKEDIPILARHFLGLHDAENHVKTSMEYGVLDILTDDNWPGNVRELDMFVRNLAVFAQDGCITEKDVCAELIKRGRPPQTRHDQAPERTASDDVTPGQPEAQEPGGDNDSATPQTAPSPEPYPVLDNLNDYRRIHGDLKLKEILERAIAEGGGAREAMALLSMPESQYANFRKSLQRIGVRVRDIVD